MKILLFLVACSSLAANVAEDMILERLLGVEECIRQCNEKEESFLYWHLTGQHHAYRDCLKVVRYHSE